MEAKRTVPVIRNNLDYEKALTRIEKIIAANDSDLDAELEALSLLVENYEAKAFPIETPDPIEVLKFRMHQLGLTNVALANVLGVNRARISELLNRRRPLSINHIRLIETRLNIPSNLLTPEYDLDG